ncbi:MAG: hypothetical protein U0792_00160 [Gemmataceae bacterium]
MVEAKYSGYVDRQALEVERFRRMEDRKIPATFDYAAASAVASGCVRN